MSAVWCATAVAAPRPMATWQTNGTVRAIRISNGVIYLGGDFTGLRPRGAALGEETVARGHAAAIDARTGRLLPWNPRVNGRVNAIARVREARVSGWSLQPGWRPVAPKCGGRRPPPGARQTVESRRGRRSASDQGSARRAVCTWAASSAAWRAPHAATWPRCPQTGALTSWAPSVGQVSGAACPPRCHPKVLTLAFSPGGGALYIGGHFGKIDGVARNEAAEISLAHPQTGPGLQPQHLRQRQLPSLHHHRDASRLHHHPHLRPRLHLRRILAGKHEPPIVQRQRLQPPQRRPPL